MNFHPRALATLKPGGSAEGEGGGARVQDGAARAMNFHPRALATLKPGGICGRRGGGESGFRTELWARQGVLQRGLGPSQRSALVSSGAWRHCR